MCPLAVATATGRQGSCRNFKHFYRGLRGGCSVLPALQDIDAFPVKKEEGAVQEWHVPPSSAREGATLPPIAGSPRNPQQVCLSGTHPVHTRLYRGRNLNDTGEFLECLTLPHIAASSNGGGSGHWRSPGRGRGRTNSPPSSSTSPDCSPDSRSRVEKAGSPSLLSRDWHIVLLPETFTGSEHTVLSVAECLTAKLGIEASVAEVKARRASRDKSVIVETCESQPEAIQKAQQLRDKDLAVRVTAVPTADATPSARGSRVRDYAKQFSGTLRGDLLRLARSVEGQVAAGSVRRGGYSDWRQGIDYSIDIVPEDAVEALFTREEDSGLFPTQENASNATLRTLIRKHKSSIMEVASVSKAGLESPDIGGRPSVANNAASPALSQSAAVSSGRIIKICKAAAEATETIRNFVFGSAAADDLRAKALGGDLFPEGIRAKPTPEMISVLCGLWLKLDTDRSGRVSLGEFRSFAEEHMKARREEEEMGMLAKGALQKDCYKKFVQKLCAVVEKCLLSKKSSFALEDMVRLVWPAAAPDDLKHARLSCRDVAITAARQRIKAPPVLPKSEFDGLCSVFQLFDQDSSGHVSFDELIAQGVIYEYQHEQYRKEWDRNGDGELDLLEFCEMMCPAGYRAHALARVGSLKDGRRVVNDAHLGCWRLEDQEEEFVDNWV